MSFICFESQCRDLELTKCCAALSKCRKSRVIIDTNLTHLGFKKRYSLHGLASQVAYRLHDEMAHVIAAENRIVVCKQQVTKIKSNRCLPVVLLIAWHCLMKIRWRNKLRRVHPCLSTASSTMLQSSVSPASCSLFETMLVQNSTRGPLLAWSAFSSHRDQGPFNEVVGF